MRRLGMILATAALALPTAAAAQTGRDHHGTWTPPPSVGSTYEVTITDRPDTAGRNWLGRVTDVGNAGACLDNGDVFWDGQREGAFGGAPTFRGTTQQNLDPNNSCAIVFHNAHFWSPADDRLRVCPGQTETDDPPPDFQSPVDASPRCTDFRRVTGPSGGGGAAHKASDYIYRFRRDSGRCPKNGPRTYSVRLRYVADDPAARFKLWARTKKTQAWKQPEVYEGRVPFEGEGYRVATFPWAKKGPVRVRVRVWTESGKRYTRVAYFKPCKG